MNRRGFLLESAAVVSLASTAPMRLWAADEPKSSATTDTALAEKLKPLIAAHQGTVAIGVQHLGTGATVWHNADEVMPTASLIKLPIMVEVYHQVAEKKLSLDDRIQLTKEDMVPGSGILTANFSEGTQFPLRDAVTLMIVFSDNTATNLVLDKIGIPSTNFRMAKYGMPNTRVNAKVFRGSKTSIDPERTKQYGLGSTTAREMITLLHLLHQKKLVSAAACDAMLATLRRCDDDEKFPRFLPASVKVAHKTGSVSDARTDAGILEFPQGPVAICVLTAKNRDQSWKADNAGNRLCADVAKVVYQHYSADGSK
ncbi:serine hydrolase [Tuwongella immobilis]|uniref:beta-lactamase n=1 Tax=Tuwongella immobilis TaxID=692036 RepID=A0A6C2YMI9_9BACT|nr:serine hydrolase [Tuwongella immobilis]VIP02810.1 Beta-lactamase class A OS=Singulisphaera acidiphila (strain ATCC BAA-1392 / DSM 18658 / VKM B-2454 / MOB10) GN=Sinac_7069 PE=4 SV=1: Beta-lactamase2 [Tuwongella immobilis]VTS02518.1 Beta-lactamase class A OS=Singulisphaera acidiphila (strain ATCC BAA-1392 / DSM 18658 / VKM B-2454 / MOB10) GN=Sinac_7069 PE=4 SV=1: Beta-lactamase2 [Tuwongella immobilis]